MGGLFRMLMIPATIVLIGGTAAGAALPFTTLGAQDMEHPEGLSLRQESAGRPGMGTGFFVGYALGRGHMGGGLRGGK